MNSAVSPGRATVRPTDYLLALLFIVVVDFLAVNALPGDPLHLLLGDVGSREPDAATRAALLRLHDLDGTMIERFVRHVARLSRGDLGRSSSHGAPVIEVIAHAAPWTVFIVTAALAVAVPIGFAMGLETGLRNGRPADHLYLAAQAVIDSVPPFAKAFLILLVLGIHLEALPTAGAETPFSTATGLARAGDILRHAIGPVATLALLETTRLSYIVRGAAADTAARPFMTAARTKGIGAGRLRLAYLAPDTVAVAAARIASMFTGMLAGSTFVETVFAYPGLGTLLFRAIEARDHALVQGVLLVIAIAVLVVNLSTDLAIARLGSRR